MAGIKNWDFRVRFWSKVRKTRDCWEWAGELNNKGYGIFYLLGVKHKAHRMSYMIEHHITDLGDKHILHRCDNTWCVNPAHLFEGNNQINSLDKAKKGRHPNSVLDENDYRDIITDSRTQAEIAKDYGVHFTLISQIKRGLIGRWATSDLPIDFRGR